MNTNVENIENSMNAIPPVIGSLPFPENYEDVKESYIDFIENALLVDIKMQNYSEIVEKIDKATDRFAKYLLRQ